MTPPRLPQSLLRGPRFAPPHTHQIMSLQEAGFLPLQQPPHVPQHPPPRQQWGTLRLSRLPAVGTPREAPVRLSRDFGEMHQGPPLPPQDLPIAEGWEPWGSCPQGPVVGALAQLGLGI
ncbi:hypothetical protein KIL84_021190 [Mauremys mutica]|uniref:Uncharacterized protein n=1 Tax=Mauremys mutica TaxID=74926 RepID=A0A9D3XB99_9SAUR|nr:hypothetical protein KIL84_021190 [Mauremys mutica]